MKKQSIILALFMVLALALPAGAATFAPSDADLMDLDHFMWYTWRIDWQPAAGEEITGATLKISDIYNYNSDPTDTLNIWLLDDPVAGNVAPDIFSAYDNQNSSDIFTIYTLAGDKAKIDTWTDADDHLSSSTLTYDLITMGLGDELSDFASNGYFGFGLDPDCHYFNSGISLDITTSAKVPEPSSLLLFGTGLIGLSCFRRKPA